MPDLPSLLSTIVAAVVVVGVALYLVSMFNRLLTLRNSSEATLAQIRVAMKKRLDMIGQLVEAVKGYAKFEREIFEKIASLRSAIFNVRPEMLSNVHRESREVLGTVLAIAERYPDLKASTTVLTLMEAIRGVEDEIARQRYTYNNIVQEFNIMRETFPSRFVAGAMNLGKMEYLKFEEEVEAPPAIQV